MTPSASTPAALVAPALGAAVCLAALAFSPVARAQTAQPQAAQQPPTSLERLGDAAKIMAGDPAAGADRDMKRVLDAFAGLNPKPIETLSPEEARKQPTPADAVKALLRQEGKSDAPEPGVRVRDVQLSGPTGPIPARAYTPEGAEGQVLPMIVYYHGGGWVIADLDTYDATPRAMAKQARAVVVSVEYRHAPEHKFPAAHDDAFAGYQRVWDNAGQLGGDQRRIAVMGESAGGNLAIHVALAAKQANVQAPVAVVAVYPVAGVSLDTPSYRENANAKPLNRDMMAWFMRHVVRSDADKQDPRLDVVGRADVKGLPPTTIITAQIDPLRSEGQALAEKLRRAGVPVELRDYEGVTHEFFGMGAAVADAKEAQAFVAQRLAQAFGATPAAKR